MVSGGWNLSQFHSFVDEYDNLHILGVLENVTGQAQESPTVIAFFRDKVGQEMASDMEYLELESVPVGGRSPFHLITFVEGHTTFDLWIDATPSDDPLRGDLAVDNVQVSLEGDTYAVTGNITNPGAPLETFAQIAVALLDETGQTIGTGSDWVFGEDLGAGQTTSFRIIVDEFSGTAVGYEIMAVGL